MDTNGLVGEEGSMNEDALDFAATKHDRQLLKTSGDEAKGHVDHSRTAKRKA